MEELARNLEVLLARDRDLAQRIDRCVPGSEIEALAARTGAPTIRISGRLEASEEEPEAEGEPMARHFLERAEEAGARRLGIFGLGVHTRPPEALWRRAELIRRVINPGIDHSHVTEGERA